MQKSGFNQIASDEQLTYSSFVSSWFSYVILWVAEVEKKKEKAEGEWSKKRVKCL